jgi:HAD superfamily hydrolase (TIGR01509 family)
VSVPRFPVYLFDVDGTLLDSAPDIVGAVQQVIQAHGRTEIPDSFLKKYIGFHLDETFRDLGFPAEQWPSLLAEYRAIYLGRGHSSTQPYPGVAEALASLGGRKSTATTKSTQTATHILELFGLRQHFEHVQGTDGFPAKPAPDVIWKSLDALQVRPEDCLLVGDAITDMQAARAAGVRTCAVTYGYGSREELARFSPDFFIDDLRELTR